MVPSSLVKPDAHCFTWCYTWCILGCWLLWLPVQYHKQGLMCPIACVSAQAARAYDSAARSIRGAGAICNFPETADEKRNANAAYRSCPVQQHSQHVKLEPQQPAAFEDEPELQAPPTAVIPPLPRTRGSINTPLSQQRASPHHAPTSNPHCLRPRRGAAAAAGAALLGSQQSAPVEVMAESPVLGGSPMFGASPFNPLASSPSTLMAMAGSSWCMPSAMKRAHTADCTTQQTQGVSSLTHAAAILNDEALRSAGLSSGDFLGPDWGAMPLGSLGAMSGVGSMAGSFLGGGGFSFGVLGSSIGRAMQQHQAVADVLGVDADMNQNSSGDSESANTAIADFEGDDDAAEDEDGPIMGMLDDEDEDCMQDGHDYDMDEDDALAGCSPATACILEDVMMAGSPLFHFKP